MTMDYINIFKSLFTKSLSKEAETLENRPDKSVFTVKKDVKRFLDSGQKHIEGGRFEQAIKEYKNAINADSKSPVCHYKLASAYHDSGEFDEAAFLYQKAIELDPTCKIFLEQFARLNFEIMDYEESSNLFFRASIVGSLQAVSLGLWGRALFEQKRYEESIDVFQKLQATDKRTIISLGARYWLILASIKLGRIASARKAAEEIIQMDEIDYKIVYDLGEHFIEIRCLSLARKIFERIAIAKEEFLLARLRLDDIRSLEKQIEEMLPGLFENDEEKILHQIHNLNEFGDDRISKAFLSLIQNQSSPIRESIIRYQTKYGYEVPEEIKPSIYDPVSYVREAAYDYFAKFDKPLFLDEIASGLEDCNLVIRIKSVHYLGKFGTIEHLPLLEMATTNPENSDFANEIRLAIQALKIRYKETIDVIKKTSAVHKTALEISSENTNYRFWFMLIINLSFVFYFLYSLLVKW